VDSSINSSNSSNNSPASSKPSNPHSAVPKTVEASNKPNSQPSVEVSHLMVTNNHSNSNLETSNQLNQRNKSLKMDWSI
jgi:hypothetical protein